MASSLIYVHTSGPKTYEDASLITRLESVLKKQQQSSWGDIFAAVRDGVVTLTGKVATNRDHQFLIGITRRVAGVMQVKDELTIVDKRSRKASAENETTSAADDWHQPRKGKRVNLFKNVPALSESLEDLFVAPPKESPTQS